jgi:hypothetical protein
MRLALKPAEPWICFRRGCAFARTIVNCCRNGRALCAGWWTARSCSRPPPATMCCGTRCITPCGKPWARLIVTALLDLAARDRPRFLQLCDWHHDAIKGMAAQHPEFGAAVLDHLPFETNQGQLTLPDYLARQPTADNGKRPLYFFTHEADANQFYALCRARGLLSINAGRPSTKRCCAATPASIQETVANSSRWIGWTIRSLYERLDAAEEGGIRPVGASDGSGVGGTGGTGKNASPPVSAGHAERDSARRPTRLGF